MVTMVTPSRLPSPKARTLWTLSAAMLWAPVFVAQVVWAFVDGDLRSDSAGRAALVHTLVFVVTTLIAAAYVVMVPRWRYRVHRWDISDTAVYTRSGWLTQESRIAPLARVQTVDTARGPLERLLDLSTVTVTTASSAGNIRITALDRAVADDVVAHLTTTAAAMRGDAT